MFLTCISIYMGVSFVHSSAKAEETIRFAVVTPRGALDAKRQWTPVSKYLESKLGKKVKLIPLASDKQLKMASKQKIDLLLTAPSIAAKVVHAIPDTQVLATLERKAGSKFGGVIFARHDSGIKTIKDIKGKKVMAFKIGHSAGAYIFQHKYLMDKGINVHKDVASLKEPKDQKSVVLAVKTGVADVGFVRSGLLEKLSKAGKIKMSDFVIIDLKKSNELKVAYSTDLYTEWPLLAFASINDEIKQTVKQTFIKLPNGHPALKNAQIKGFTTPQPLDKMVKVMKELKIKPFN